MDKTAKIKSVLTRGVEKIFPSTEALGARLMDGAPMRIYFGIDPTGPSLHIGHAVSLLKLKDLQDLGHHIILLIGDFTATIGDPTDKTAARQKLTREEVLENCKHYQSQAGKILDMSKVELRYNSEWLAKLSFAELLELSSRVTFAQIIKRDMFQKRLAENKDLFLHEFLYPLMQGYDSVVMDVDIEIGGNDQMFNMLVGRDLMKSIKQKDKIVLTSKLLVDPTGRKMGKSEGNMVTMEDAPEEMFGKIMSQPDALMPAFFECATRVPLDDVEKMLAFPPRDAKMRLAYEITKLYHGEAGAQRGEEHFVNTIQNKEVPTDIPKVMAQRGDALSEVVLAQKLVASKGEFTRLVKEGGVSVNNEKLHDPFYKIVEPLVVKIGRLRYLRITL